MDAELIQLTEEQRRTARAMAGLGVSRRHIALHLGVDEAAMMAKLRDELELAEMEATSKVAKALFVMATQKNNVAAAIFWMKARGRWTEKQEIEATVNGDVQQRYVINVQPRMSEKEWLETYAPKDVG
ncbi:hypothetical protein [Roseomonas sp. CECT 9278]|uniref:hypothetical protein n=1 Tax=Roseomonas sp. CECT 9278 TaxID=2845823 RepID=UPI001E46AD26|nr:hypothetical protein [Roseomonas sp. CECT 9278]CAH0242765.1 hypothetical protein ROS9278_02938 [Roseomonas sp. CECT 9278]